MNKKILLLLMTFLITLSPAFSAFAESASKVADKAELLTSAENAQLENKLEEITKEQQFDVTVLTVNSTDGKDIMDYADDYYDENDYGCGEDKDGCLLVINMTEREWWITTTGYGIEALTDYGIEYIGDEMLYDLQEGNYYDAFAIYADLVNDLVTQAKEGEVFDIDEDDYDYDEHYYDDYYDYVKHSRHNTIGEITLSVLIGFIIALIIVLIIKKSYKPVKFNKNAANYLVNGSLRLSGSYDNFKYRNVTQVRIDNDPPANGGSGGSSVHPGSSGPSHGGGGGHR